MNELLVQFETTSSERKRLRRVIIKKLRDHKEYFRMIGYNDLLYKMNFNYMGDYSDPQLMVFLKKLIESEQLVKKEKHRKYIFNENQIVA